MQSQFTPDATNAPQQTAQANPNDFDRLYAEWRCARATWDLESYSPENYVDGAPKDIDDRLCGQTCAALNAFLLHPATTSRELAIKLRVFRDEGIEDGWTRASEIVALLASDAHRLAFGSCP